jgi:hypothetical protein
VWDAAESVQFHLSSSDLSGLPIDSWFKVRAGSGPVPLPESRASISISTATGLFTGSFRTYGQKTPRGFRGAILQPDFRGGGYFHGATLSGKVAINPSGSAIWSGGIGVISTSSSALFTPASWR